MGAAFLFLLSGCVGTDRFGGSRQAVESWGADRGFVATDFHAGDFTMLGMVRGTGGAAAKVYIEGDGAAWTTSYHPPADPTPETPMSLALAAADPAALVVYLGRPCQYQSAGALTQCHPRYWTTHRFAPEVLATYQDVLDQLRQRYGIERFTLVGYSGGGVIAALLANRRVDVAQLMTVAAPLAVETWTSHHGVTPLAGSLDPLQDERRADIRQRHLVGTKDRIVPYAVVAPYALKHGGEVRRVNDFDHQCCWSRDWPQLLELLGEM